MMYACKAIMIIVGLFAHLFDTSANVPIVDIGTFAEVTNYSN